MVVVMDEGLRAEACGVATQLRARGRRVDLVLQAKKMKWVFKQAERCGPQSLQPAATPTASCNCSPVTTAQLQCDTDLDLMLPCAPLRCVLAMSRAVCH